MNAGKADRVDLYRDSEGKWRWRYISSTGRVLADSGQGYRNKADAIRGLERVVQGNVVEHRTWTELESTAVTRDVIEVRVLP